MGAYLAVDRIAVSTWGVDVGLVDADGRMLERPRHYRSALEEDVVR